MNAEEMLGNASLFSELSRRDLKRLAGATITRAYKKGDTIVKEGETAVAFYLITKGRVNVMRGGSGSSQTALASLGPGEFFGEMAILDSYAGRRVSSRRRTRSAWCSRAGTSWRSCGRIPFIAVQMLPVLSRRIRKLQQRRPLAPSSELDGVVLNSAWR